MADNELENQLKEGLLNLWKNNAVFRDNIAYLTQVQLRALPEKIINETLNRADGVYRYEWSRENTPPQMRICTF